MDDFCSTIDTLDVGAGERLHDGRIHSYTAGYRNRCGADQNNSGTKPCINDLHLLTLQSYDCTSKDWRS